MKFDRKETIAALKNMQPIFSKAGSQYHPEWILFSKQVFYARNGYFFVELSQASFPNSEHPVFLNGVQLNTFLKKSKSDEFEIEYIDEQHTIVKDGKRTLEFNSPINLEEFWRDFYSPVENANWIPVRNVKSAIETALKTVYPNNIEFSNVYFVSSVAVSSDGTRITTALADDVPDTSIPMGTDKALFFEPDSMYVLDDIQRSISMVSFTAYDGISEYTLSVAKNIGNAAAITHIIPQNNPRFVCKPDENFKDILETGKQLDQEFKKQDIMVEVKIDQNMVQCALNGRKTKYREDTGAEHEDPHTFNIHPGYFFDGFAVSDEFLYDPELNFIQFQNEDVTYMVAIET